METAVKNSPFMLNNELLDSKIKALVYISRDISDMAEQYGADSQEYSEYLYMLATLAEELEPYKEFIITTIPEYAKVYNELLALKENSNFCMCRNCTEREKYAHR